MDKLYERIIWHNNTTPALNETNLNLMSKGLDDIDDRVVELSDSVLEVVPQIVSYLEQAEDLYEAMQTLSENPPYIGANGNWYVFDTTTQEYVDSGVDASITVDVEDVTMLNYGTAPYVTNTGTDTDPVFHLFIPRAAAISSITKTGTASLVDTYTITTEDGYTATFTVTNGKGINSITKTGTSGLVDTYTITYSDGTTSTFTVTNGEDGEDGRGIVSVTKTSTSGLVDTYTIAYTDNTSSTFTVTNGRDGSGSGDMLAADYDSDLAVKNAGGIKAFVNAAISALNLGTAASKDSTNSVTQSSTDLVESGAVYTALLDQQPKTLATSLTIDGTTETTVEGALGALVTSNAAKATTTAVNNKHKVTSFEVTTSSWTQDTTSQSGTTLYKKSVSLSHVYVDSPSVEIGAASGSVLPTTAQQTAYELLQYATCDSAVPCLYLYASDIPTDAFYINVEGVD